MDREFLKEYIHLIPQITPSTDDKVWWSSLISSKNRFYEKFSSILLGKSDFKEGPYQYLKNFLAFFKHILVLILRIFISKWTQRSKKIYIEKEFQFKKVTLIKTFSYHHTDFKCFEDPMFKNLKETLEEDNHEHVLTLYEPVNVFRKSILSFDPNYLAISYFDYLNVFDVFKCLCIIISSFVKTIFTQFDLSFKGREISLQFKFLYLFEHFSPSTIHSLTYYYLLKNISKKYNIQKYIYTYENNPWERLSILALREFTDSKIIAYQHNVIPLASANMFLAKGEELSAPCPDLILTTGPRTKEILEQYGYYKKILVTSSCALRYEYLDSIQPLSRNTNKKELLIALEGVWQASDIMNSIFKQSDSLKDWVIKVRSHPALPYDQLSLKIDTDIKDHPHFQLSTKKSLKDDIESASIVLYWGSTVGLESIKLGRAVINIQQGKFNFDPLFELNDFKRSWDPKLPLIHILNNLFLLPEENFDEEKQKAQSYLSSYFHPCTKENLQKFF